MEGCGLFSGGGCVVELICDNPLQLHCNHILHPKADFGQGLKIWANIDSLVKFWPFSKCCSLYQILFLKILHCFLFIAYSLFFVETNVVGVKIKIHPTVYEPFSALCVIFCWTIKGTSKIFQSRKNSDDILPPLCRDKKVPFLLPLCLILLWY